MSTAVGKGWMPLSAAKRLDMLQLGEEGKSIHVNTLAKWCRLGVRGAGGRRVLLRGRRVGRRWFVTEEAVAEFLAELARPADGGGGLSPAA